MELVKHYIQNYFKDMESKSNKFTKEQMDRMGKLKPGNSVILKDIRAKGPDGKVVPLSPIPLTLN